MNFNLRDMLANRILYSKNSVTQAENIRKNAVSSLLAITEPGAKFFTPEGTKAVRVDPVKKRVVRWDELLLNLTARQRDAIMVEVPSETALLGAVASKLIPADLVDKYSDWNEMSPYFLVTEASEKELREE